MGVFFIFQLKIVRVLVRFKTPLVAQLGITTMKFSAFIFTIILLCGISISARAVADALVYFVPGYTYSQDRNETLFSTRGISATSQQKVLILLNGHRINSRS